MLFFSNPKNGPSQIDDPDINFPLQHGPTSHHPGMPARSSQRFNTFSSDVKNLVRRVQASVQQAADLELRRATEMEKKFTQLGAETQFISPESTAVVQMAGLKMGPGTDGN